MPDSRILTRNLWATYPRCHHNRWIMQDANDSADSNSALHGQNQEKENIYDYWIDYLPFEYFFCDENKKL